MTRVVYKYPIDINARQYAIDLRLPADAKVVAVQVQRGVPCVWIELNPAADLRGVHRFELIGTGHEISDDGARHVGTVLLANGDLVLHVYHTHLR